MAEYGRVIALQNAIQGQKLQQQQLVGSQQENEMRGVQLQQMQALNSAYKGALNPDGSIDTGKLSSALAANGAGSRIPDVLKGVAQYQQTIANLGKTRAEVANLQADALGSLGHTLQTANYDPQLFLTKAQAAVNAKAVDPQSIMPQVQQVQQALQQDPTGATARQLVKQIADSATASSQAWQKIQAQQETAQGAMMRGQAAQTDAAINQAKAPAQIQGQQLTNQKTQQEVTGTQPVSPYQQAELKQGANRNAIEAENAATQRKKFDVTYGAGLNEQGVSYLDGLAKQVSDLQVPPPSQRSPIYAGVMSKVAQLREAAGQKPYDLTDWQNRAETMKGLSDSSPSSVGGQALALNTMIHHADLYQQVAAALKNGNFRPGNAAFNALAQTFGAAPPGNTKLVAHFLGGEVAKLAQGGAPFESELRQVADQLSTANSPDQIANAGKTLMQIASGRAIPLQEKLKAARIDRQIVGPDAQAILKRNGYDPNTLKPVANAGGNATGLTITAPNGKTYNFKSQADLENFKKDAGLQ